MSAESMTFKLAGVWDGSTPITTKRTDLEPDSPTRFYEGDVNGSIFSADFFELFSKDAPKIVSVAMQGGDPLAVARVVGEGDAVDNYRQEVDLTSAYQSVVMGARDQLYVMAPDRAVLWLVVNELNEAESVRAARDACAPEERVRRFRITRGDNQGWNPLATPLTLNFSFNNGSRYMEATTNQNGAVPVKSLFNRRDQGAYVWVRGSNIGGGALEVFYVHPTTGEQVLANPAVASTQWTNKIWVGFDDMLTFRTGAPPAGKSVVIDIEMSHSRNRN